MKTDTDKILDGAEPVSLMEPLLLSEGSSAHADLVDLALELVQRGSCFDRSLPPGLALALSNLMRSVNCYYSNLIEGRDIHPVIIEHALQGDESSDPNERALQLEAKAHIAVERWIDEGGLKERALTTQGVCEIHRRFREQLPDELLAISDGRTSEKVAVVPGAFRGHSMKAGTRTLVSAGAVPRFMERFEDVYGNLGRADTILAAASAHHRLAWLHPFPDDNGRVVRLMSHAILREALGSGSLWSISRGLGRRAGEYRQHLAACDLARRNNLDGCGPLSEEALAEFTEFFLRTCIEQIKFMEILIARDRLRCRISDWAEEEIDAARLPPESETVLEAFVDHGELPRADVAKVVGSDAEQARRIIEALVARRVLTSDSPDAPLRLALPAALASRWMPGLYPEQSE